MSIGIFAHAGAIRYEKAERNNSERVHFSRQQADSQSAEKFTPTVNITFHGPESSPSPIKGVSPISNLMEELLIIIFDDVITSESTSWKSLQKRAGRWRPQSPPRNLASVCKMWRSVVFGCPMLWRHVIFTPDQPNSTLREHLCNSSPFPIHLIVHQWPFRNPVPAFSIVELTAQLQSILSPVNKEGVTLTPACHRVESITIHATESSTFFNFVLQTWTAKPHKFPALRRVTMNGNACATWSRACFFDRSNAPLLDCLELHNVVITYNAYRLPCDTGLNLTTLVWAAPTHKDGELVVSLSCFHHVASSFPNLRVLELRGHVVRLERACATVLEEMLPLTTIRELRLSGPVFPDPISAFVLFYMMPGVRRLVVRGRACTGPTEGQTVMHALQAMTCSSKVFGLPMVLGELDELELDCMDGKYVGWRAWCVGELERWRAWRETMANVGVGRVGKENRVRVYMIVDVDEGD